MEKEKRQELFEKLYFQAGDIQDKLHTRVQGVFALALAIASAISYILKNMNFEFIVFDIIIFSSLFLSFLYLIKALKFLAKAFWGNQYAIITTPEDLEHYRLELEDTKVLQEEYNLKYPTTPISVTNPEIVLSNFYYEKIKEVSTTNINVNSDRQEYIHESVRNLFKCLAPFAVALLIFLIGNLDSSAPRNTKPSHSNFIIITDAISA